MTPLALGRGGASHRRRNIYFAGPTFHKELPSVLLLGLVSPLAWMLWLWLSKLPSPTQAACCQPHRHRHAVAASMLLALADAVIRTLRHLTSWSASRREFLT